MTTTTHAERKALAAIHYGLPLGVTPMRVLNDLQQDGLIIWNGYSRELTDKGRTALAASIEASNAEADRKHAEETAKALAAAQFLYDSVDDDITPELNARLLGALDLIRKALA